MKQNPQVIKYDFGYAIRYIRNNYKVIMWMQGSGGPCIKDPCMVSCPIIQYETKEEAEVEVINKVIPYLIKWKGVSEEEIVGW
jgi:hypothetical protein